MIVKPTEQDLIRREPEELLERLVLIQQAVQLGVQLDVDLGQEPLPNDLPDEAEDEVLPAFDEIRRSDVDDGESEGLGGTDDKIVVLRHLERVRGLGRGRGCGGASGGGSSVGFGLVQYAFVDRVGHSVVDELREYESICACS